MKETAGPRTGRAADALPREDGDANGEAEILIWNGRIADPREGSDGDLVRGTAPSPGPLRSRGQDLNPATSG